MHLVNEQLRDVTVQVTLDVMLFNGTNLGSFTFYQISIPANNRVTKSVALLLPSLDLNSTYVRVNCYSFATGKLLDSQLEFYVRPIYRNLPEPDLNVACDNNSKTCLFSTTNYASYVYLELNNADTTLRLSNNFFDLTPG